MASGADFVMLPYFQRVGQVRTFLELVRGRAKTVLLFETPEAVRAADEILRLEGIDECYIGLNDLHLGYHQKFLFQPLADGTVEMLCRRFQAAGKPYGFGGVARVGVGALPAERILAEHVRLGSSTVILSRSFCNARQVGDYGRMEEIFHTEVARLRSAESLFLTWDPQALEQNRRRVQVAVRQIAEGME